MVSEASPSESPTIPDSSEPEPAPTLEPLDPTEEPEGGTLVRPTNAAPPESSAIPRVERYEPTVGTTDADAIRRVVRQHLAEVRACYDASLARDPELRGRLVIAFVIGPSGAVEQATATDSTGLGDPDLATCIEQAIETWVFPQPRGGGRIEVSYPFNLVPE